MKASPHGVVAHFLQAVRGTDSGRDLVIFLALGEFFLELHGGVGLELEGGQRNPREDVRGTRPERILRAGDETRTSLDKKS